MPAGIARLRNIARGDYMPFRTFDGTVPNFRIAGVLSAQSKLVSSDLMRITAADFRKLFGIDDRYVTDVSLRSRIPAKSRPSPRRSRNA
ncbi:MAG: hypothetical protein ACU841_08600 [Gammaproteobacteria bacterium]